MAVRNYHKISNISYTKSQNLNDSSLLLQLSFPNPLKPGVETRMKMWLEQRRQEMLQLGDAPTTSEWSTSLLATKVHLILEIWRYMKYHGMVSLQQTSEL